MRWPGCHPCERDECDLILLPDTRVFQREFWYDLCMNPDCTFSMTRPAWVDAMLIESYLQVSPALERLENDRVLRERLAANVREIDRHLREISERYQVPATMFYPRSLRARGETTTARASATCASRRSRPIAATEPPALSPDRTPEPPTPDPHAASVGP